ncbi:MAG: hypothetical protein Kow0075_15230 [Salibacteraceae bacterium]
MNKIRPLVILFSVAVLLSIPLVAMQFTDEVNWDMTDFVVMGGLLLTCGALLELTYKFTRKVKIRLLISVALLLALFLIWVELSVGVFGSPFAGD